MACLCGVPEIFGAASVCLLARPDAILSLPRRLLFIGIIDIQGLKCLFSFNVRKLLTLSLKLRLGKTKNDTLESMGHVCALVVVVEGKAEAEVDTALYTVAKRK